MGLNTARTSVEYVKASLEVNDSPTLIAHLAHGIDHIIDFLESRDGHADSRTYSRDVTLQDRRGTRWQWVDGAWRGKIMPALDDSSPQAWTQLYTGDEHGPPAEQAPYIEVTGR